MKLKTNVVVKGTELDVNINFEVEMSLEELVNTNTKTVEALKLLLETKDINFGDIFKSLEEKPNEQ